MIQIISPSILNVSEEPNFEGCGDGEYIPIFLDDNYNHIFSCGFNKNVVSWDSLIKKYNATQWSYQEDFILDESNIQDFKTPEELYDDPYDPLG